MRKYEKLLQFDEGKKQALQTLKKKIVKKFVADIIQNYGGIDSNKEVFTHIIEAFEMFDPTKHGKYLDTFAHIYTNAKEYWVNFSTWFDRNEVKEKLIKIEKRNIKLSLHDFNDKKPEEFLEVISKLVIKKSKADIKKARKQGIKGLKSDTDYIQLPFPTSKDEPIFAYIPINREASMTIANIKYGGVEGKWCIAYTKDPSFWDKQYVIRGAKGIPVYLMNFFSENPLMQKVAIMISINNHPAQQFKSQGYNWSLWDVKDGTISKEDFAKEFDAEPEQFLKYFDWDDIREKILPGGSKDSGWEEVFDEYGVGEEYQNAIEEYANDENLSPNDFSNFLTYHGSGGVMTIDGDEYQVMNDNEVDDYFDDYMRDWELQPEYGEEWMDSYIYDNEFEEIFDEQIKSDIDEFQYEDSKKYENYFIEQCVELDIISKDELTLTLFDTFRFTGNLLELGDKYLTEKAKEIDHEYLPWYIGVYGRKELGNLVQGDPDKYLDYDRWHESEVEMMRDSREDYVFPNGYEEYSGIYISKRY